MWHAVPDLKSVLNYIPDSFAMDLSTYFSFFGFIFYGIKQAGNLSMSYFGYVFFTGFQALKIYNSMKYQHFPDFCLFRTITRQSTKNTDC